MIHKIPKKNDLLAYCFILLLSIVFVFPAVFTKGLWASFDSPFHITMITQFYEALRYGQFPVIWTDGVANYGLSFGLIAHPLTSYLGALIMFIVKDPIISYKILWLLFTLLSGWGVYRLCRRFTTVYPALAGSLLYIFSAYRILNLYIRGALPEFVGSVWLLFLLYALFEEIKRKRIRISLIIFTFWYSIIFFTHPMFILFSGILTGLFLLYYRPPLKLWLTIITSFGLALAINAFYLIPLNLELKYFYLGISGNFYLPNTSLTMKQFIFEQWEYTCANGDTPLLRCNRIQTGIIESAILLLSPLLYLAVKNKPIKKNLLFFIFLGFAVTLILLPISEPLFAHIKLLGSLQYIYRFLNIWILFPSLILALFLHSLSRFQKSIILGSLLIISVLRIPQIYVKNVTEPDIAIYYHNIDNIHSVMMNTVWMGEPKEYPIEHKKGKIIEGQGRITSSNIIPTKHIYKIDMTTPGRLADYTFYFPGWHVYIDGKESPIQWQDPSHRGYITVSLPRGNHVIKVAFTDTKVRLASKMISIIGLVIYLGVIILYKKNEQLF